MKTCSAYLNLYLSSQEVQRLLGLGKYILWFFRFKVQVFQVPISWLLDPRMQFILKNVQWAYFNVNKHKTTFIEHPLAGIIT